MPIGRSYGRTHFQGPVAQTYKYRGTTLWPSQRAGQWGQLTIDAVSGDYFPLIYAVKTQFGVVDGRDGSTYDTDQGQHTCPITMRGPYIPPRYGPVNPEP